ncbi:hypothetical protein SAMN04487904_10773 [Actinopolyspora lacussalsi subsp. righensis]|uniref:PQQ-like domain-containing protein n=1 Tax=Actinopolyspora righensis TaxID=995060 RepID=A0A1I7AI70_9ACTN|nr:hypothetical protein [Actinopolyspora righensis]SFT74580.1 hypothetical protein SAMN04487904_10773 [Actinopolyspora righensis]
MVRPERRTKSDIAVTLLLTVAVLSGAGTLWWFSSARATELHTADRPIEPVPSARTVPEDLNPVWRAPSSATPHPVVAGPAVVTGNDGAVVGRDPATGEIRWRYSRERELCTVGSEWGNAIAVYRTAHHCSAVTTLHGSDGERGPQRNSDVGFGTRLLSDGSYVTATGQRLFETWRSDMVRTQQYGTPTDIKNPDNNLSRPNCDYSATAVGDRRVAVIAECAGSARDRLTVLRANPEDGEQPEEVMTTLLGGERAGVVAVNRERVAVVLRDSATLVIYDMSGKRRASYDVRLGATPDRGSAVRVEATSGSAGTYWYTGRDTIALDESTLRPRWTVRETLGTPAAMAEDLLVPVEGGLAVHDSAAGEKLGEIPIDRKSTTAPVRVATVGNVVLEQRGDTVFAYR